MDLTTEMASKMEWTIHMAYPKYMQFLTYDFGNYHTVT